MITAYVLVVYSCIIINNPLNGELISKNCNWNGNNLFSSLELCEASAPKDGSPIFSDVLDGRKVEKHQCNEIKYQ